MSDLNANEESSEHLLLPNDVIRVSYHTAVSILLLYAPTSFLDDIRSADGTFIRALRLQFHEIQGHLNPPINYVHLLRWILHLWIDKTGSEATVGVLVQAIERVRGTTNLIEGLITREGLATNIQIDLSVGPVRDDHSIIAAELNQVNGRNRTVTRNRRKRLCEKFWTIVKNNKCFFRLIVILFTLFGVVYCGSWISKLIIEMWTPDYSNQPQHTISPIELNQTPFKTSYNFNILNEFNASQINTNERNFGAVSEAPLPVLENHKEETTNKLVPNSTSTPFNNATFETSFSPETFSTKPIEAWEISHQPSADTAESQEPTEAIITYTELDKNTEVTEYETTVISDLAPGPYGSEVSAARSGSWRSAALQRS